MSLLKGCNVVITGASRGVGRGVAIAFGEQGANVYITGRSKGPGPGSLEDTARLVREAGGNCEYFVVDHGDDEQIAQLFENLATRFGADRSALHVFVNNAYAAVPFIMESMDIPFWKKNIRNPGTPDPKSNPGEVWDLVNGVGLRSTYICATRALRMMEPHGSGVIVNITSWAGLSSLFDVSYSIGKEAVERMAAEIAAAAPQGIKCFAFCPGWVSTDHLMAQAVRNLEKARTAGPDQHVNVLPIWNAESPLFVGRALAALFSDKGKPLLTKMNGKVVIAAEVADILKVNDEQGRRPLSCRTLRFNLMMAVPFLVESPLRHLVPRWLKAPWLLVMWLRGAHQYWN